MLIEELRDDGGGANLLLVGISINLGELRSMGHKPFVVGLIAAVTVGIISLIYIETVKQFLF